MSRLTPVENRARTYGVLRCLSCPFVAYQRPGDRYNMLHTAKHKHESETGHVTLTARSQLPFDVEPRSDVR